MRRRAGLFGRSGAPNQIELLYSVSGAIAIVDASDVSNFAQTPDGQRPNPNLNQHWGSEMKRLVATIALLCLSSTVLAHDMYSNLRDRDGRFCCNGQDCRPVQVTVLPNGSYYLPRTNEIIPADKATPSPDDHFHHCTYSAVANDFEPGGGPVELGGGPVGGEVTRCFFAPMHSS
jgi:hypothetical protein